MNKFSGIFTMRPTSEDGAERFLLNYTGESSILEKAAAALRSTGKSTLEILDMLASESVISYIEEVVIEGDDCNIYEEEARYLEILSLIDRKVDGLVD